MKRALLIIVPIVVLVAAVLLWRRSKKKAAAAAGVVTAPPAGTTPASTRPVRVARPVAALGNPQSQMGGGGTVLGAPSVEVVSFATAAQAVNAVTKGRGSF